MTGDESATPPIVHDRSLGLVLSLLLLIGFAEVYWATARYGPGVTPDSLHYMAAGQSLLDSGRLLTGYGTPYRMWPPLFPMILGGGTFLSGDPLEAGRWINALSFGATAALVAWLLHRSTRSIRLALAGGGAILCSWPVLFVASRVWSEPLFIFLSLASMGMLGEYLFAGRRRAFGYAIALASLACLQRYLGIAAVAAGGLGLLLFDREPLLSVRLRKAIVFGALSMIPVLVWLGRNHLLFGSMMVERPPPLVTPWESITQVSTELLSALLPHVGLRLSWAWLLIAPLGIALAAPWFSTRKPAGAPFWSEEGSRGRVLLVGLFGVFYVLALLAAANIAKFDRLGFRPISPALPPLIVMVAFTLYGSLKAPHSERALKGVKLTILAIAGLGIASLVVIGIRADGWRQAGVSGFNTSRWRERPVMHWVSADDSGRSIVSSESAMIEFFTGREAFLPPRNEDEDQVERLNTRSGSLWVWIPDGAHIARYMTPYDAMELGVELSSVAKLEGGEVFRIQNPPAESVEP